jgi:chromosome segregation ATPase
MTADARHNGCTAALAEASKREERLRKEWKAALTEAAQLRQELFEANRALAELRARLRRPIIPEGGHP